MTTLTIFGSRNVIGHVTINPTVGGFLL